MDNYNFKKIVLKELKIDSICENKTYLEKKLNIFFSTLFFSQEEAKPLTHFESYQLRNYLSNYGLDKQLDIRHIIKYRVVPYFNRVRKLYEKNLANMKNASFIDYNVDENIMGILNKNGINMISDLADYTNEEIKRMLGNNLAMVHNLASSFYNPKYKNAYQLRLMEDYINSEIISMRNVSSLGASIRKNKGVLSDKDKETMLQYGFFKIEDILETPNYVFETIPNLTNRGKENIKHLKNMYIKTLSTDKCQNSIDYAMNNTGFINLDIDMCNYKKLGTYIVAIRTEKFGYSPELLSRLALHTNDKTILKNIENGSVEMIYSNEVYNSIFKALKIDKKTVKSISNYEEHKTLVIDLNKEISEHKFNIFKDEQTKKECYKACLELQKKYISLLKAREENNKVQKQIETGIKEVVQSQNKIKSCDTTIEKYERQLGGRNGK